MASLKDLIVNGAARIVGTLYTNNLVLPTTQPSNPTKGSTYTDGTKIYVYNGTSWITLG